MPVRLNGSTSGYVELASPAVGGSTVLELPTDSIKPAMVLINTTTFSAASSVSVNNCFTNTYDNYKITINGVASASVAFNMRLRTSGTDATSAVYYTENVQGNNTALSPALNSAATSYSFGSIDTAKQFSSIEISEPALAVATNVLFHRIRSGTTAIYEIGCGYNSSATAYDGFTIYPASGTITGTVRVYGYRNSL